MSLPGKHMEQLRLAPSQMQPRGQLKKPLRDILRDISRKSKATVDMRGGPGGSIIFEGKGSVDAVRQALKEVAQQVGSKVCPAKFLGCKLLSLIRYFYLASNPLKSPFLPPPEPTSLAARVLLFKISSLAPVPVCRCPAPTRTVRRSKMTTMIPLMS